MAGSGPQRAVDEVAARRQAAARRSAAAALPATDAQLPVRSPAGVVSTSWGRRDRITRRVLAIADMLAIVGSLTLAALIANDRSGKGELIALVLPTLPVWLLILKLYGLYDRDIKRISHSGVDDIPWLFHSVMVGTLLFWVVCRVAPIYQLTLYEAAVFGSLAVILMSVARGFGRSMTLRMFGPERMILVGAEPVIAPLVEKIRDHPEYGLRPVGLLHDAADDLGDGPGAPPTLDLPPLLGDPSELEAVLAQVHAERVVICRSDFPAERMLEMIDTCRRYSVKVSLLPDALESLGPSVEVDEVEGVTLLGVNPPVLGRTSRLIKRGFDLVGAGLLLALAAPLMILIALLIRRDSPGGALFRQTRVGLGGRRFTLLKFRTMVSDAEARREELMQRSSDERWLHIADDPRITKAGAWLRRSSLDELPQLFNVIRGEMSLVGPRPLPDLEDANVSGWARGRLDLTPGITGLWQVLGRTSIPFEEMVKLDYLYVTNWSLWMDLRLLMRTLPAVLRQRGVN